MIAMIKCTIPLYNYNLDSKKANGIDGIGPKILKYCVLSLFHTLCYLFNLSLSSGTIPSE